MKLCRLLQNHANAIGLYIDRYAFQHLYMIHTEDTFIVCQRM